MFSYTEYGLNIYHIKVKLTLGQTMKARGGIRAIALLFLYPQPERGWVSNVATA
jgi:hypothetical protein